MCKRIKILWYQGQKVRKPMQACLQEDFWPLDLSKTWASSHFLKKNEWTANFLRIARVQSTWQSGIKGVKIPFDTNIILWINKNIFGYEQLKRGDKMFHVKHFVENQGTITWCKSLNCEEIMVYLSISRKVE